MADRWKERMTVNEPILYVCNIILKLFMAIHDQLVVFVESDYMNG